MSHIAIAATAAAAVVGAAGAMQASAAAKATAKANQQGYERAAQVVEQQKQVVDAATKTEIFKFNRTFNINQAKIETAYLKSGVSLDGTPEDVMAENAKLANFERKVIGYNSKLQKKKLDDDATMLRYTGEIKSAEGQMLARSYQMKAVGSLLQGVGSTFSMTQTYNPSLLGGNSVA